MNGAGDGLNALRKALWHDEAHCVSWWAQKPTGGAGDVRATVWSGLSGDVRGTFVGTFPSRRAMWVLHTDKEASHSHHEPGSRPDASPAGHAGHASPPLGV